MKPISGFPEFLPSEQIVFERCKKIITEIFESYGFVPLETPAVERLEALLTKGNAHEIYGLYRVADEGEGRTKDLGLRFDLTVPLARYVAQHYGQLTFPYRRYQIAPVWRGERPQSGRYRQFYQCDIDVIGDGVLSPFYDAEVLVIMSKCLSTIGVGQFTARVNNRKLLTSWLEARQVEDISEILKLIDKKDKLSFSEMERAFLDLKLNHLKLEEFQEWIFVERNSEEWISFFSGLSVNAEFKKGLEEITEFTKHLKMMGMDSKNFRIDPSLARGLAYYTGTIYEIGLNAFPELGSICGGGRYANLAEYFSSQELPGVGMSIGLTRLIPFLMDKGILKKDQHTPAVILIALQDVAYMERYFQLGELLRNNKINAEIYLGEKKLKAQLKYADRKGFHWILIAGEEEFQKDSVILRNLQTSQQVTLTISELVTTLKKH